MTLGKSPAPPVSPLNTEGEGAGANPCLRAAPCLGHIVGMWLSACLSLTPRIHTQWAFHSCANRAGVCVNKYSSVCGIHACGTLPQLLSKKAREGWQGPVNPHHTPAPGMVPSTQWVCTKHLLND